jgi:formate hydrogenlyase subunit 6/NADH:ubiquinone oxidoreductase subunit I
VGAIDKGTIRTEHCQFCYSCVDHCPKGAFDVVDVWRLAAKRSAKAEPAPETAAP